MKIVTLKPEQFDEYAKKHRYRNYYQTTAYGNTMKKFGYRIAYLGVINETNNLVGATLILYKQVFMNNKIAYAPRGVLFDFETKERTEELETALKQFLGKRGFMLLRMDPYIPLSIRSSDGSLLNINRQGEEALKSLSSPSFIYKGKNLYFENEKSRWEALILLNKDIKQIFSSFDKRTQNKIRKATNLGIEIYKDEEKSLKPLYEFIKKKEKKPISFYETICSNFGEDIDIYYARLNTETFIVNTRKLYEREVQNNDQLTEQIQNLNPRDRNTVLNKKMESDKLISAYKNNLILATELLKKYPKGMIIGGAIVINYDNAAFVFTEGFDEKYTALNASYLLKWRMIDDYNKKGHKYLNINAVVGEFEQKNEYSGLNEMKLGFHSIVTEYIGEFDLILNNLTYNLYKNFNKEK